MVIFVLLLAKEYINLDEAASQRCHRVTYFGSSMMKRLGGGGALLRSALIENVSRGFRV